MYVWEWHLMVLRRACEFRLDFRRKRHSDLAEERARCPYKGPAWEKKSENMALLRQFIYRELDEIRHIKQRANAGPIKGGTLVLWVRDGKGSRPMPGPSIINIIERERDKLRAGDHDRNAADAEVEAQGLDKALEILANPYRYLTEQERTAYDAAESNAAKITKDAGARLAGREDRSSPSTSGRPPMPSVEQLRAQGAQMIQRK